MGIRRHWSFVRNSSIDRSRSHFSTFVEIDSLPHSDGAGTGKLILADLRLKGSRHSVVGLGDSDKTSVGASGLAMGSPTGREELASRGKRSSEILLGGLNLKRVDCLNQAKEEVCD